MSKILLLNGGSSSEREVSLRSGAAVKKALEADDHDVTVLDPANEISDSDLQGYDVIFPVLHGSGGEDGSLQARLEGLGITTFVGSDAASSSLCFDKWRWRQRMIDNHVTVAEGAVISIGDAPIKDHPLTQQPFVLKPYNGGSSVDTFIVRDVATADFEQLNDALLRHGSLLIESLIEGIEITVGVLGDQALPVVEIVPPSGGEFDYENKYNGATLELCPPKNIPAAKQVEAQSLAARIHFLCGCRDLSRTDMILANDDTLYVLETNTLPGMTDESLLPKAAAAAGIPMAALCSQLADMAARHA